MGKGIFKKTEEKIGESTKGFIFLEISANKFSKSYINRVFLPKRVGYFFAINISRYLSSQFHKLSVPSLSQLLHTHARYRLKLHLRNLADL